MSKAEFEWDNNKDIENQQKHNVSFYEAQHAFLDENRVIAKDISHSQTEKSIFVLESIKKKMVF